MGVWLDDEPDLSFFICLDISCDAATAAFGGGRQPRQLHAEVRV